MRLFSILFTVFLDYLGVGLVFPFFFPMIMEPTNGFLDPNTLSETRGLIVGMLLSSYSLAQFWSLPLLGAFSDRLGRKKVLSLSLIIISFGFFIGYLGVIFKSIYLLFLSRIIAGIGSGNYAVAQASIADMTYDKLKHKYFGLLNTACGLGFVVGPFLGGWLSNFSFFNFSSYATPFLASFVLTIANVLMVSCYYRETLTNFKKVKISFFKALHNFQKAFTIRRLKLLFLVMFIFSFGWGFLCEFLPLFLIQRLNYTAEGIGYTYAYLGFLVALFQGLAIRPFINRFSSRTLLMWGLFCLAISTPFLCFAQSSIHLLILLLPIMFFEALIYPSASSLVSDLSLKDEQGQNLGIHQSVQSLAFALAPLFSGSIVVKNVMIIVLVGAIAPFLSFIIIYIYRKVIETNETIVVIK
jgi:DHA1 family tetracycline resistance protein-like MFS transporter